MMKRMIAAALGIAVGAAASGASAQIAAADPALTVASLVGDGQTVAAGDILRTTRVFPNWNLNCEVLLSQGRHLCAVELRSVDQAGRQVFAWSIALSTTGAPIMVLRITAEADRAYGLRMTIGAFTTILTPSASDCTALECRMIAPFETPLRTLMVSQSTIAFSLMRAGQTLNIVAPLAGLSDALEAARRDPIGLRVAGQARIKLPDAATLRLRMSQKR